MSKRFTATEKWSKQWFRELTPRMKCLWQYLCDNADAAGVWEPDFGLASYLIGQQVDASDLAGFGDRISPIGDGKIIINSFVEFQYGKLSPDCKPHAQVLRLLDKHRVSKGYPKGIHTLMDKDKEKDKEKDKGSAEGKIETQFPTEIDTENFRAAWVEYLAYRASRKLPKLQSKSVELKLREMAGWGEPAAIESIRQCIANGWSGTFAPRVGRATTAAEVQAAKRQCEAIETGAGPRTWNPMEEEE